MLQWAIELSEYANEYQSRLSMKGQAMADFVVESSQNLLETRNRTKKSGGPYELPESLDHR
ncbi:hypothetical protein CK203_023909 [Vitis vinifera]|uniref:Uncharacterized protein n=1 Tax=Vitis vinifera TaxID=29760 RepID=A0A438JAC6_VITVI|nr:hypothetical protein CK203_023909 [Vitis vinifera]